MKLNSILPKIAAVIVNRVPNFDAWKIAFDAHADARRAAGILGHSITRSAQDPHLVSVYLAATDKEQLERFLASDDLAAQMRAAEIAESPTIAFLVPQEDRAVRGKKVAVALMSHDVEDYDRWKAAFDVYGETWYRGGLVGHSISRSATRPNQVLVYLQAESRESLRAIFGSTEGLEAEVADLLNGICRDPSACNIEFSQRHKATFARAGLRSRPQLSFLEEVGRSA